MQEKILVVDDDPAIIRIVELVLTRIGYEIATANCGEEAYQLASSFQPDLIILDINMPGGCGWNVLRYRFQFYERISIFRALRTTPGRIWKDIFRHDKCNDSFQSNMWRCIVFFVSCLRL